MSRESNYKETGYEKQSLGMSIFGGAGVFSLLVFIATILPYRSDFYLLFSAPIGAIGFLNFVWLRSQPNLFKKFVHNTITSTLFIVIAYRGVSNLFPQLSLFIGILIVFSTVFAHTLPMWNLSISTDIRDEMFAPKTKIGKIFFGMPLIPLSFIGILAAAIGSSFYRQGKTTLISTFLGILCWCLAIAFPLADGTRTSPWDKRVGFNYRKNKE